MTEGKNYSFKDFLNKVLAGSAAGVVISLIPNAVLSAILGYFDHINIINMIIEAASMFQMTLPLMIGVLIAAQFKLDIKNGIIVGAAAFVASGVVKFDATMDQFVAAGTGDIINVMITSSIAVLMFLMIKDKFGSVSIIALPIVVGIGASVIGMLLYPMVSQITLAIGLLINEITSLQPILMSILITIAFALIIISPVSTVAIGLAIQLDGLAAGAAGMGVATTALLLVLYSYKVNSKGVTLAIGLGGMKMMMPNLFKYPIIMVPIIFNAIISAIPVALFQLLGTPASAGFGLVGLVSPLASLEAGAGIIELVIAWIIVPLIAAYIGKILFEKVMKLYDSEEVFKYQG